MRRRPPVTAFGPWDSTTLDSRRLSVPCTLRGRKHKPRSLQECRMRNEVVMHCCTVECDLIEERSGPFAVRFNANPATVRIANVNLIEDWRPQHPFRLAGTHREDPHRTQHIPCAHRACIFVTAEVIHAVD